LNFRCDPHGDTAIVVADNGYSRAMRNENMYGSWDACPRQRLEILDQIIELLKCRLFKMVALDEQLHAVNLEWLEENSKEITVEDCREESERLKNEIIGNSNVRFYDILANGINQVAMYARNESIVRALEAKDYQQKFSVYGKVIEEHFNDGQRRLVLLNSSSKNLNILCRYKLPEVAVCEIFGYLRDMDLENFIAAFAIEESQ